MSFLNATAIETFVIMAAVIRELECLCVRRFFCSFKTSKAATACFSLTLLR